MARITYHGTLTEQERQRLEEIAGAAEQSDGAHALILLKCDRDPYQDHPVTNQAIAGEYEED